MFKDKKNYCGAGKLRCSYNVFGKCTYKEHEKTQSNISKPDCYDPHLMCNDIKHAILAAASRLAHDKTLEFIIQQNEEILKNQKLIMEHFNIKGER